MERPNAWKSYTKTELKKLEDTAREYKAFIDAGKTERECVEQTAAMLEKAGYALTRSSKADLVVQSLLLHQCQGMDNSQKLSDIISTLNRTKVEYLSACCQINSLVLHGARVTTTGCIHSPRVCPYLKGQGQYRVVSIVRRVLHYILSGTSMPSRAMAFLMILATFLASIRRMALMFSSGSLRME